MARKDLSKSYKTVIVGGGIVGAGILRELALHGVEVLLIDKADFTSQTSQSSSKMLHGGIRYLENMDFPLVFEALREKNLWLKLAPHLAKESPFFLPVYRNSKWPLSLMKIGLFIYDLLSLFKNSPHKSFNKRDTLESIPGLKSDGLKGSGMYYDGIVDDSKLTLDCIFDSIALKNANAENYLELIHINEIHKDNKVLTLKDSLSGEEYIVNCEHLIFATGPFTDQVMKKLNIPWDPCLLLSKGSHIWLNEESLRIKKPMVLQTKDQRVIFVIPQRKTILVGTTEIPLKENENILNIQPEQEEIDYLLDAVNEYFPTASISHKDIVSSFAGVRPLVKQGSSSSKTSRKHIVKEVSNKSYAILGGKYTTFRVMGQDIAKIVLKDYGIKFQKNLSTCSLKHISLIQDIHSTKLTEELIDTIILKEKVRTKEDLIYRRLSLQDGTTPEVLIDKSGVLKPKYSHL